jgi:hypothetical protein
MKLSEVNHFKEFVDQISSIRVYLKNLIYSRYSTIERVDFFSFSTKYKVYFI